MGVPASQRLRANREFQEVRRLGNRIHCGPFIVNANQDPGATHLPRFGVVASRRVGNAVKRNRGKRLFRELFRRHAQGLPAGTNLVVVLRSSFDRHDYQDLERRFGKALGQMVASAQVGESVHHEVR